MIWQDDDFAMEELPESEQDWLSDNLEKRDVSTEALLADIEETLKTCEDEDEREVLERMKKTLESTLGTP